MSDYLLSNGPDNFTCYDTDPLGSPRFFALAGDDALFIQGSSYREFGGLGNDVLFASYHFDGVADASQFNDIAVYGGKGDDTIILSTIGSLGGHGSGDGGNDFMQTNGFGGELDGGNGADTLYSLGAGNVLFGGNGNDMEFASHSYEQLMGGTGNDLLAVCNQLNDPLSPTGSAYSWAAMEGGSGADMFRVELDDTAQHDVVEINDYSARQGDVIAPSLNSVSLGNNAIEMNGQQLFAALDHNGDHTLTAADGNDGSGFYVDQTVGDVPSLNLHIGGSEIIVHDITHLDFLT